MAPAAAPSVHSRYILGFWALHKSISLFCDLEVPKPPTLLLWNTLEIPGILGAHHQNFSRHSQRQHSLRSFRVVETQTKNPISPTTHGLLPL
ncbi:unnamed protein product [Arctogadus glacialis]